MLQIDDTIVSLDLFDKYFVCDLAKCKGACCIEGDAGAPLEQKEIKKIEEILPIIWNDLSKKSKKVIKKQGVYYMDEDQEFVTSIVDGKECVFTYFDDKGICKCVIEKAYKEGKVDFIKPISCHLYPVRVQKYRNFEAVNYHKWSICNCAIKLGGETQVPLYQFLKNSLVRRFGVAWYEQLSIAAQEMQSENQIRKNI